MHRAQRLLAHVGPEAPAPAPTPAGGVVSWSEGPMATLELCREDKLNALNLDMVREMARCVETWVREREVKCVLLKGRGKAFCAGGDVAAVRASAREGGDLPVSFFREEYVLDHTLATLLSAHAIVQVSVWDGVVMGGGVGLSVHGPVRVCSEHVRWAMPETAIGLFPDVGTTFALPRVKGGIAMGLFIALTGCTLSHVDCIATGLATHFVPRAQLAQLQLQLASAVSAYGYSDTLADVAKVTSKFSASVDVGSSPLVVHAAAIERCFNQPSVQAILQALAADPDAAWAQHTRHVLEKRSPTSLAVTLEALRRAAAMASLGDALAMEYRLSQRLCAPAFKAGGDFDEGVRAVLVDKDKNPKWQQGTPDLDAFFAPLPASHPLGELVLVG